MTNTKMNQKLFFRLKVGERRIIILLGDFLASFSALLLALVIWARESDEWLDFSLQFLLERPPTWFYILPVVWVVLLLVLSDIRKSSSFRETLTGIFIAAMISTGIYLVIFFLAGSSSLPRLGVGLFFIFSVVFTFIWRFVYIRVFTAPAFMRRVIIVGAGNAGTTLVKIVKETYPAPFHLVGLIDDDENKVGLEIGGYTVLGTSDKLLELIDQYDISDVVFAISGEMKKGMLGNMLSAEEKGVEITTMPIMYEEILGRVPIFLLNPDWVLRSLLDQAHVNRFYRGGKRLLDLLGGLVGCFALLILLPFIAIAIKMDDGGTVFYSQPRLGRNGKSYQIIKFRTMKRDESQIAGGAKPTEENDARVTPIGRILRRSHLDELPQFFNILKGEMSLVGPRAEQPMIVEDLQENIPFYRSRLFVKPGLTGWAQINYGYASNVEQNAIKLEYDLYYIKHRNIGLDIAILFQTVSSVIGLKGR